jgi:hypothetical protein
LPLLGFKSAVITAQLFAMSLLLAPVGPTTRTSKRKFTQEEDLQIIELLSTMPQPDWQRVASQLGTRSPRQCRERWRSYLHPDLKTGQWTREEDAILRREHANVGPRWATIALFLPGRSEIQVKNRWLGTLRHKLGSRPRKTNLTTKSRSAEEPSKEQPPRLPSIEQLCPNLAARSPGLGFGLPALTDRWNLLIGSTVSSKARPFIDSIPWDH